MYKNIFFDYNTNLIHRWDDISGYSKENFIHSAYRKTFENTEYKSIFGDVLEKVNFNTKYLNPEEFLESDVKPEHRFLIDHYGDSEEISRDIKITSLDIEVELDRKNPKSSLNISESPNKILAIGIYNFWDNSGKVFLLDESKRFKNIHNLEVVKFTSEKKLLTEFLRFWYNLKPEIVTGWNTDGYDFPYLYNRIGRLFDEVDSQKKNFLSPIGICRYSPKNKSLKMAGISSLDYMKLYKKFTMKTRSSYKLDNISKIELKEQKVQFKGSLQDLYENDIDQYVKYNYVDNELIYKLDTKLGYIEKARGLAHMAHIPYEDVISSVATTEGLFLSETKKLNLVCPSKPSTIKRFKENSDNLVNGYTVIGMDDNDDDESVKSKIVGAFVKPASKGLYKYTYDEDLASLYPLIAVTLNISPETKFAKIDNYITVWTENDKTRYKINHEIFKPNEIVPNPDREIDIVVTSDVLRKKWRIRTIGALYNFCEKYNLTISANGIFYKKDKMGIIPRIIDHIFEKRVEYKKLRDIALVNGDMVKYRYYDNSQWRMKIVINTIYGVLCNEFFRFYDKDNAQSITLTGQYVTKTGMDTVYRLHRKMRETIKFFISERMEKLFKDPIVAGDTDSIIMTAEPILCYKFGENWEKKSSDDLLEETLRISKKMSSKINERMDIFGKYWLNSNDSRLRFKEEWVASTGFYSGVKKRYANRIMIKEGVRLSQPETDIKGLDIVRSDFPESCKEFMTELLDRILDEKHSGIDKFVLSFYDELTEKAKHDYKIISKTSSVNTMNDYIVDKYDFGKGTPVQVKSALNYNKYLNLNELNGSFREIVQGEKIQWVYLKKNIFNFDSIAIPQNEYIPPLLEEFISENLDINKTIKALIETKLESYYYAMDWTIPSQEKTILDFFN